MVDLRQVTSLIGNNKTDRGNLQWFLKQIADLNKILQYWNYSLQIPSGQANWSMRSAMLAGHVGISKHSSMMIALCLNMGKLCQILDNICRVSFTIYVAKRGDTSKEKCLQRLPVLQYDAGEQLFVSSDLVDILDAKLPLYGSNVAKNRRSPRLAQRTARGFLSTKLGSAAQMAVVLTRVAKFKVVDGKIVGLLPDLFLIK